MQIFDQLREMGHERVLFCSDAESGLKAIIAIHSTLLGPGLGGLRMWPFASDEEALTDVLRLSRGMTYKAAVAGLELGGAKAVILGDPKRDKTEARLRAFGRFVDSLGGAYITAEDVGTSEADMEIIRSETRWVTGISPQHGGGGDPSPVTAYGVLNGIKAAVAWTFGDGSLAGRSVAVQGLGSVGYHLAAYLREEGASLYGADIDPDATERARETLGAEIVAVDRIAEVECDVLAPCALGASLNDVTIPRLRCRIVAGGANNQLHRPSVHGRALFERDILYAPDYVINAGGLINVFTEYRGDYDRETALAATRAIHDNVMRVFEISSSEGIPTDVAADRLAERRLAAARG
jgi:leucine dehydrogenase